MKRSFLLAALLLAASACQPTENSNLAPTNTATPQPSPAGFSDADIIAQERQVFDALKAKNWDAFAAKLADDQLYVSGEGVFDKAQSVEAVKKLDLTDFTISDTKVLKIDKDAAVLTYTSVSKGTYDGKPLPEKTSLDTTVWVSRGGKWLAAFHQETPAIQPPPPSGAAASNSNSATPTPASHASPSPASASPLPPPANAIEADKQVWASHTSGNHDLFAAFLLSDFLEVEPDGIFTKAETTERVKHVDFSGVAVSDFKEVKLDADASVVTAVVKAPGNKDWPPPGMRHSTVWVNRGGRWQVLFHQGSIIEK